MKSGVEKESFMLRHIKGLIGISIALALVSLILGSLTLAQTGTTSLRGTVLDKSGANVPGAKVKLENKAQALERETATNDSGGFEFPALSPGTYSLTVEKDGFRKYQQSNVQLLVNLPATLNVILEIGTTTEVVEVSA